MIDPAQLADMVRVPDAPDSREQVREAVEELRRIFHRQFNQTQFAGPGHADLREERFHQFWLHLVDHPKTLSKASVDGVGALKEEIRRFLRQCAAADSKGGVPHLRKHLWHKVKRALVDDDRFAQVQPDRWRLGTMNTLGLPKPLDGERLDRLPTLPYDPIPQRSGQIEPIVDRKLLPGFLQAVLEAVASVCSTTMLRDTAWDRLRPRPEERHFVKFEEERQGGGGEARRLWCIDIDRLASAFLDETPEEQKRLVAEAELAETANVRTLEHLLPFKRTKVSKTLSTFRERFLDMKERKKLSLEQAHELSVLILERLYEELLVQHTKKVGRDDA